MTAYHQEWADRLNEFARASGQPCTFTPEFVADAERLSGKLIAEMSPEDWDNTALMARAEAITFEADAEVFSEDADLFIAAMDRRDVKTVDDLFAMLSPDDDDFEALHAAYDRFATRIKGR